VTNQLADDDAAEKTGLLQIVHQPTRGQNVLERIFVSFPLYSTIRVVTSVVRSDHKAVVAYAVQPKFAAKTTTTKTFKPISPSQNAQFLYYTSTFVFPEIDLTTPCNVQTEFDVFYDTALRLLNHFYPKHTITVTSRDPHYITPHIKAKLRKKNRLMRAGQTEKASALALRISKDIANRNQTRL